MRTTHLALAAVVLTIPRLAFAQAPAPSAADPRAGRGFIATPVFSAEEDRKLLALFEGLRVADVTDGMDAAGLQNVGLMDPEVRPLWKDTEAFTHRFVGIAVTARYVPTQRAAAGKRPVEEYDRWSGDWYNTLSPEPFQDLLRPGTALVIDDADRADVGSIGSNNIMAWKLRGVVGVVTNATARDTDEVETSLLPAAGPRHPAGAQRDRVGEPAHRLRWGAGRSRRRDRRRRRRRARGPARGRRRRRALREAHPRKRQGSPAQALREARPAEGQVDPVGSSAWHRRAPGPDGDHAAASCRPQ